MALSDPQRISTQYGDSSNLDSRITLHQKFNVNGHPWHRWVFDHLDLPPDARILEIGCGTAALWLENHERIAETWRITLTEASPGMIANAEGSINLNFRNTFMRNFTFMSTDARSLPFADDSFDAVVANYMLYHVAERAEAISEAARVLGPGGVFYAATNGREHMREVDRYIRRLDPDHPGFGLARNFSGFTLENGEGQLSEYFSEVSVSRREDGLRVTEAGPLMAWVLSTITVREVAERVWEDEFRRRAAKLSETLEREVSENGEIHITKDAGLFMAGV